MTVQWPKAEDGYLIERTDYPAWLTRPEEIDQRAHYDATGEQAQWGAAIPLIYRLLAAPRAGLPYPEPPWGSARSGRSDLPGPATIYWTPLLHLLMYSFGWSRPDLGMKWWIDAGQPVDDHRLRLIADLWGRDGRLNQFLSWLWSSTYVPVLHEIHHLTGHRPSTRKVGVDEAWLRQQAAESEAQTTPGPGMFGDSLHLSVHTTGPADGDPGNTILLHSSTDERRAVLLTDQMTGWYRALTDQAANLPDLGDNSWYVDVAVKPVGHLGTYRRSRETGLWFSGPHSLHIKGI